MSKNRNWAEIGECNREIAKFKSQISDCRSQITDMDGKIERLEAAKKSMGDKRVDVSMQKNNINRAHTDMREWKGDKHNGFQSKVADLLDEYESYHTGVGTTYDTLKDEVKRLKQQKGDLQDTIGDLNYQVSDWSTYLRQLTS